MKAIGNGGVVVEGNHDVPAEAPKRQRLPPSPTLTTCSWKGQAHQRTPFVEGDANPDAARSYPTPGEAAAASSGRIAFGVGAQVVR